MKCDLLDPKNDYVVKRLFGDAPDLLVAPINAVRRCAAPITPIAVKNPAIDAADLEKGRAEALRLTAINLIQGTGLSDATIAAITGLGVADLAALRRTV